MSWFDQIHLFAGTLYEIWSIIWITMDCFGYFYKYDCTIKICIMYSETRTLQNDTFYISIVLLPYWLFNGILNIVYKESNQLTFYTFSITLSLFPAEWLQTMPRTGSPWSTQSRPMAGENRAPSGIVPVSVPPPLMKPAVCGKTAPLVRNYG